MAKHWYAIRIADYETDDPVNNIMRRWGRPLRPMQQRTAGTVYCFRRKGTRDAFVAHANKLHPGCYSSDVSETALQDAIHRNDVDYLYEDDKPDMFIED